jgi:hypothetical protein
MHAPRTHPEALLCLPRNRVEPACDLWPSSHPNMLANGPSQVRVGSSTSDVPAMCLFSS